MPSKIVPYKKFKGEVIKACNKTAKKHRLSKRDRRLLKVLVFSWTGIGPFREDK